ncbi:unnamed protein product, partial [Lymnaea stagnalis]
LGVVGNGINVVVLSSPKFRDTTSFLLLSLSVADFFASVTELLFRLPNVIMYFQLRLADAVFCFYMTYIYFWNLHFVYVSIFYVSLVAVERMIAVCFPFHVASLVTMFRVKFITVTGFMFYAALFSPNLNMLYTIRSYDRNNETSLRMAYTDFYKENYELLIVYRQAVSILFVYALPILTITVCTAMVTSAMALNWRNLKKLSSSHSAKRLKEMKSSKTALCVCLSMAVFILIPSFVFDMLSVFREDLFPQNRNRSTVIYYAMTLIYELNSFLNFIIYVATSSKFAREFKELF